MPKAIISSTKYDGSLHYTYEAPLVSASEREIRVYTPPNHKATTYRGEVICSSHALRIFYTDRPWNLFVRWYGDWRFESYYVNIARPATWDGRVVSWVDMDLDIIFRPGADEPVLDDEDEFERHRVKWGYTPKVVEQSWRAVKDVWSMMKSGECPFDGSLHDWRPGADARAVPC